jgi:hypothetical protein
VSDPQPQTETASKPDTAPAAKPVPAPKDDGADAVPASAGQPATPTNVIALLDRKLGDVLVEAVLKHPGEAGHLITEAIADAGAPPATVNSTQARPTEAPPSAPKAAE